MTEQEPQHWPTERMINEGHADYATPQDLEAIDDSLLQDIAQICEADLLAPDECIPCLAQAIFLDRQQERLANLAPKDPEVEAEMAEIEEESEGEVIPELLDLAQSEADAFIPVEVKRRPYVEILQLQVAALQDTIEEILHGPPIPPKNVTLTDLALLSIGAERWVRMTEAQGVDLSPEQQAVLDSTKALVARFRS